MMAPFSNVWLSLALYSEMAYFQMCGKERSIYIAERKQDCLTDHSHAQV